MIKYALISRGSLILADYTDQETDFAVISKKILIQQNKNQQKQLFIRDDYIFCFFGHQEQTFLCVCDNQDKFKQIAFQFLDQLKDAYIQETSYGKDVENSGKSQQAILSLMIKNLMDEYNKGETVVKQLQNLAKLEKDIEQVNEIAKQSIDKLMDRELKISNIEGKSKYLSISSNELKYNSKRLKKKMEGSNGINYYLLILIILVFFAIYKYIL
ncbi:synaptobrevin (macronuclear) [Tetrahymena thermophila SB210]|uniref:Synaptobrevin n=1 Tax=Tetrahymena thermophila (strain SB210) TaxID=312017 RepID=I7MLA9_TETTS|nr:synaptobrevin [Tetrahymena thermophila SB210]EAS01495.2 synaptobrevin [Tetrahymena thermophila SB210]|eukprot:XP_001021741.2 synaptobrevin [Tetrahymena thermophila SB210]